MSAKSQLQNVSVEFWDDIRNRFENLLQSSVDRFTWHRDILPRYRDGRLNIHVRILAPGAIELWWDVGVRVGGMADNELKTAYFCQGEYRKTMLVNVYENVEQRESLIPSIVRLHRSKISDYRVGNLIVSKQFHVPVIKFGRSVTDRKVEFIPTMRGWNENSICVSSTDLPHDVIKGTTQIVKAIADNGADSGMDLIGEFGLRMPTLYILLSTHDIRLGLDVRSDCIFDGIQVFLCPDDFQPCAIE